MNILSHVLAAVALMASAVIYGTDVFCAIVQRPARRTLPAAQVGQRHYRPRHPAGDRRRRAVRRARRPVTDPMRIPTCL